MKEPKKLTRKQINERLEQLRKSWPNEENYFITQGANAMCYMRAPDGVHEYDTLKCGKCGKMFKVKKGTTYGYDHIAKDFCKMGMAARFVCYCNDCSKDNELCRYEMWVRAQDETEWHKSFPKIESIYNRGESTSPQTSAFEYGLVLDFLRAKTESINLPDFFEDFYNIQFRDTEKRFFESKQLLDFSGIKTVQDGLELIGSDCDGYIYNRCMSLFAEEYKALTYKGINGEKYTHERDDADFIKTQIDRALNKVLGLEIIYELAEVKRNIEFLFKSSGRVEYIDQAIEILIEERKTAFTLWEYVEFMDPLFSRFQEAFFLSRIIHEKISYNEIMHDALMAIANKWVALSRKTFSKIDLERYVVDELIPKARISANEVKKAFIGEFSSENFLRRQVREFAEKNKLDTNDRQKALELSGFIEPLKYLDGKETVSLAEIEQIQKQINEKIRAFCKNFWSSGVDIKIVYMRKEELTGD